MESVVELKYALDTFYFLVMGAFVMLMACGFAMLEAGLVRSKNTAEILTKNIVLYSVACTMYLLCGYSLMYPPEAINSLMPGLPSILGGTDNEAAAVIASEGEIYYSNLSDFFFQAVFVAAAMSIVSGAVAERMKLWSFLLFAVFMASFIYPIEGYWKWGGGFLDEKGFLDFAGSGVVHMAGATAALAGVMLLGARKGKYGPAGQVNAIPGANLPLATLGTFLLWFGWFGFNGGSELVVSDVAKSNAVALIFVNTNAAAAGGCILALITSQFMFKKADLTMALNGALAGLVSITAEPLTPTPLLATIIGGIGGILVVLSILFLDKRKIDDPVGAISVHGTAGIWGLLAVCLSNSEASMGSQILGIVVIFGWVFITSLILWTAIKSTIGIRVTEEEESDGLDVTDCGLEAYPEFTK